MVRIGHFDTGKRPGIVAVIVSDVIGTAKKAEQLGADILEVRIDLLGIRDEGTLINALDGLKDTVELPLIITNRCQKEGGRWPGPETERIDLLITALDHADAVDVELQAPDKQVLIEATRKAGKTVIISSHDFEDTPHPDTMSSILRQAIACGADIAKLAVTPKNSSDTLHLLQVTEDADFPVCTIAMGRLGRHTRVVAPIYGSVLTYGSVDNIAAPGQLRIDELKHIMEVLL